MGRFELIRQLEAGETSRERAEAARKLGEKKDPGAIEPLIAALKDEEADVRLAAAQALGEIRAPGAVEPLTATQEDSDSRVGGAAQTALCEIERAKVFGSKDARTGHVHAVYHGRPYCYRGRREPVKTNWYGYLDVAEAQAAGHKKRCPQDGCFDRNG